MASSAALGLDIGGTKLATGVVTEDGRTHGLIIEPTRKNEGPDAVIGRLLDMGARSIEASGLGSVIGVGVSCGGPLDAARGILHEPLHLPGWIDIPITDLASARFGVPGALENDATAAALGEYQYGAGRGSTTMLYLTISTGIGGGAVINGTLHRGAAGNGGEFGHVLVRSDGRECLCGRRGCLEVYASGTSIAVRATEAVRDRGAGSSLAGLPEIRAEHVVSAAASGDPLAVELWTETTELLASALTDLVNVLEPDLVVLGGGVTRSGDALLVPVREAVKRDAMAPAAAAVRIELAGNGDQVGVVGAAAVAFDALDRRFAKESNNG
jgi:glucokinase